MKDKVSGMPVDKGLRPTSPVHVHVDDDIPVHVHVKQKTKKGTKKVISSAANVRGKSGTGKRTTSAKSRSKSPSGPWVPAPGRATKGQKLSWQWHPAYCHCISPGRGKTKSKNDRFPYKSSLTWQGPTERVELPTHDLSTDEEEIVHGQMRNYERKINTLMSEMGSLKNEVEVQKGRRELEKKEELLETSRHVMDQQERELEDTKDELNLAEHENKILRKSVELLSEEADINRRDVTVLSTEREKLMKKLIEVEMDGQAAVKQISELRDALRRMREENRVSSSDANRWLKQKDILLEKLSDFESTNRTLRRLLREQHQAEVAAVRMGEQRDQLIRKLADADRYNERLRIELADRDHLISELRSQIVAQKTLESARAQDKIEIEHLQELVSRAKEKADRDKDALKKATRVQKQRAERSQDALEKLNSQLLEREAHLEDLRSQLDLMGPRYDKMSKEKSQMLAENSALKTRLEELETLMDRVENSSKVHQENVALQLHDKQSEISGLQSENERLKASMHSVESKLQIADEELVQLRGNLKQYENLVEEYKAQMNRSRREADDTVVQLEEAKKHNERLQHEGEFELEKVKVRLHQRLQELEPLPDMLKSTELRLFESQERMLAYERKNVENTKLIAELTAKVEHVSEQLDQMRNKFHESQDDNKMLQTKLDGLERKCRDSDDQNRELMNNLAKREEALHQTGLRLEEKSRENAGLTRQLENALSDIRRQAEQTRDKASQKERTYQTRISDLESQMSQLRAEMARVKREKEENERKFNSRLYDLKDRLEQSHSTNRSMQNYVQFLKNSYANVFGDNSVSFPSTPMGPGIP